MGCTMGLPRYNLVLIGAQILLGLFPVHNALNINPLHIQDATATAAAAAATAAADVKMDSNSTLASSCHSFLCVRDGSSSSNGVYPWLINNNNARFSKCEDGQRGLRHLLLPEKLQRADPHVLPPLLRRGPLLLRVLGGERP